MCNVTIKLLTCTIMHAVCMNAYVMGITTQKIKYYKGIVLKLCMLTNNNKI